MSGLMISKRTPDEPAGKEEPMQDDANHELEMAMEDFLRAMNAKDSKAMAVAIKDAFDICDAQPHEEGPHTNDYDEQNEKASDWTDR